MKCEKPRSAVLLLVDALAHLAGDDSEQDEEKWVNDGKTAVVPLSPGRFIPIAA